ncbi:PilT/PilU family type 4a pilus ATPase [Sulfurovum sp.]|jgi:twitching motility protein PilT|uniref:type IV pilus twitching motility protein PilT n=1 Tax=Sulfurovum sp. TaxID=1969726 RepID=UPI002A360E8D|nr:PilT/PilU family type 4a pilus ATPase [Sulfurovum sp.]MDD2450528.1 PilT/PilU family type 4a pilus ATPase [Sulfurovum sp.]MDD3499010.1 PilT/PilU family type 4a pilus ATPase [Sulfurovum sp.]MDY0403359.1 PilT/PilU family type 4a pilus ATPase [Sulfurovum sp.]
MEEKLKLFLRTLISNQGSDLHLKSGAIARIRVNGQLKLMGKEELSAEDVENIVKAITTAEQYQKLKIDKNLDFTYVLGEEHRFRVNVFYQMDGLSAVFRVIPVKILSIDELGLPEAIKTFTEIPRGLVLVTGVTGSGKSTTLAAMIEKINEETHKHIITIEDPIEFIHKDRGCLINQRAIGQDTHSFSDALRGALREDPDIILVGEMRDLETIDIAMHAANTGHLVFSTLHTADAKETIDRIVGMFANEEQNRVRNSLASVLEGVISQRLIPTKKGGRIAGIEILKKTARIEQLIKEKRDYEIPDALFEGKDIYGTQTFDQHLIDLIKADKITEEVALENASNPSDLKLKMQGIGRGAIVRDENKTSPEDIIGFKDE